MTQLQLDRRLHAFRPDLADIRLKDRVEAARFVAGEPARIGVAVAALRPRPDLAAGIDTELLFGDTIAVFEHAGGFAWVQAERDGYVGYLPESFLVPEPTPGHGATHRIATLRSFVYPEPDLRSPATAALSIASRIAIIGEAETRGTRYFLLAGGGAVIARHCLPLGEVLGDDYVAIAARFVETPYLWGGCSGFGVDCSGLVQLSLLMAGRPMPRDSDMQAGIGTAISRDALKRGDLVFWKGHVAIMEDEATVLHASGHAMTVVREDFEAARARIAVLYGEPSGFRRL